MVDFVIRHLSGFLSNPRGGFLRSLAWGALRRLATGSPERLGLQVLDVLASPHGVASSSIELYPAGARIQIPASMRPLTAPQDSGLAPAGVAWRMENVAVTENQRFQSGICGDYLVLSERDDEPPWQLAWSKPFGRSGRIVAAVDDTVAVAHGPPIPSLQRAIFVGTRAPRVWAHWLVNFLPSVFLASRLGSEFDDFPLIVPSSIPLDGHWSESLLLAAGGRSTVAVHPQSYLRVRKMLWIEPPVYDTPFPRQNRRTSGVWLSERPLLEFRELFLSHASSHASNLQLPENVFLARKPTAGRSYNQSDCIELAAEYGFVPVYAEDLSFADKLRLFRDARNVIGPGGSGFSNLLFSGPETAGFFWWHLPLKPSDNFDLNIAAVAGSKLSVAPESWLQRDPVSGGYLVKLNALEEGIQNLLRRS